MMKSLGLCAMAKPRLFGLPPCPYNRMKAVPVMETGKKSNPSVSIRDAVPDDLPFLRSLALEAFSVYGDYETILTGFFVRRDVHTYVAEEVHGGRAIPVGLLMMILRKPRRYGPCFAEILAIAVERNERGKGIGSRLIEFAKRWPLSIRTDSPTREVRLSVAESNIRGLSFFRRHGFEIVRREPWRYPAGQRAFGMRFSL
ncbi:MAG: GNAT family N-acetyltransferase [Deltaproteobacteria bacterium]|nr:GNAT family N-acetyltransferase [Deltaproteobacteria bacterium]